MPTNLNQHARNLHELANQLIGLVEILKEKQKSEERRIIIIVIICLIIACIFSTIVLELLELG